jgi:hypothetical protein
MVCPQRGCHYGRNPLTEVHDPIDLPTDADVDAAVAAVLPMMGHGMRQVEKTGMRANEIVTLECNLDHIHASHPTLRLPKR